MLIFTAINLRGLAKGLLSLALTAGLAIPASGAVSPEEDVITLDARRAHFEFKPGEVIVKFKNTSRINIKKKNGKFQSASNTAVDNLLRSLGVEQMDQLMPLTGATGVGKKMRAFNGTDVVAKDLSQLYIIKMAADTPRNVLDAVNQLSELDEVEYAEPNYLVHALDTGVSESPDDPMYELQYGIEAIKLDQLWGQEVLTKEGPVIAILDTGVEITHPDLEDNIWTNPNEADGSEGYDDDGNGFVDDIHGWDFINNTGRMDDYNGHGTHCAGIAAACGFNGKGIVGANPDAKIMPLTVLQSNGTGDIATIVKAVDYAAANGAKVISMSLGSYATSISFEEALGKAYQNAIIVAAAGNDGLCLNHAHPELGQLSPMPMFPAAYTFVLGVQASAENNGRAGFSNYDDNGPIYSEYPEYQLYNYELTAPGVSIMSTYPGGTYKYLNGTSMATPLVAGALSRLLQAREYDNWEMLFGDLIHKSHNGILDIMATYLTKDEDRVPTLYFIGNDIDDSATGDGDGRPDAGEVIEIYPWLRADWGSGISDIRFSITLDENEQTDIIEILDNDVEFGRPLSSYSKGKSANPLKIKIKDDCTDGRIIKLQIHASSPQITEELVQSFEITAENGVEIGGMITEDLTLYPNVNYILTQSLAVPDNVTLTILPGTTLSFKKYAGISLAANANLICNGEVGNLITFKYSETEPSPARILSCGPSTIIKTVSYVQFKDFNFRYESGRGDYNLCSYINLENCIINNIQTDRNLRILEYTMANQSNYYGNYSELEGLQIKNSNFIGNPYYYDPYSSYEGCSIFGNYFNGELLNYVFDKSIPEIKYFDVPNYWGSSIETNVRKGIWDINTGHGFGHVDLSNMLTRPSAEAHGIVWKVLVDGKDAQDEFDDLAPLGVGEHTFEVYFNRQMNTKVAPSISMGVRPPYTQIAIAEDGKWNETGEIYTAKLTIKGNGDYDGLNRIYVYGAEDDEFFPIPPEDMRFNVYVSAAGSMSEGFLAEAGLGKVTLTWDASDDEIDDVLGYNLYRYTVDEEGNESETIQINQRLVDDTEYVDYDVVPGTTYLYYYKTLRTNMSENSPSKVVAAKPLTAEKGDADGSMSVNVADVVSEISYIIGGNPQPFIFEAADVNDDLEINVLDVVGTVNIINTPTGAAGSNAIEQLSTTYFSVEDGILYVECDQPVGGVQVRLNADKAKTDISKAGTFTGFEEIANWLSDNEYLYMIFSMTGQTLTPGKHALLNINNAAISELVASSVNGGMLPVEMVSGGNTSGIAAVTAGSLKVYPNPADDFVNVEYTVARDSKVFFILNNLQGALVDNCSRFSPEGNNTLTMNVSKLPAGIYFLQMIVDGKTVETFKVIKK